LDFLGSHNSSNFFDHFDHLQDSVSDIRGTLGADKGYCAHDFVEQLRDRGIEPHVAVPRKSGVLDKQTQQQESYKLSQRKRKLVEQPFGWMKTVGRIRKTTQKGIEKNDFLFSLHAALYNVVRFLKLVPATA
jgi:hypothetical protein